MSDFEFNNQLVPQSLLSIEDSGQCAIEGIDEAGQYYYLVVVTLLGETTVAKCGPVVPDIHMLPNGFSTELITMNYDAKKLESLISKWLNDKKKLVEAKVIDRQIAVSEFRDLGSYIAEKLGEN